MIETEAMAGGDQDDAKAEQQMGNPPPRREGPSLLQLLGGRAGRMAGGRLVSSTVVPGGGNRIFPAGPSFAGFRSFPKDPLPVPGSAFLIFALPVRGLGVLVSLGGMSDPGFFSIVSLLRGWDSPPPWA
ncbi:hypothetical protein N6H14_03660 [Paenibacillus sp. CC-CFT747]|nr:hypothetical protein N6H14_03660 [Paenibacillus sp. CC-CFT747]